MSKVLILPGDGIGQEIVAQALKVIDYLNKNHQLNMTLVHGLVGGAAYDETASPLPQATLDAAHECDSILLGAVGGYQWEKLERDLRPERGLLGCVARWTCSLICALRFYTHNLPVPQLLKKPWFLDWI